MRRVLIVLILSLCLFNIFGYSLSLHSTNSQEWKAISALCIANGVLPPSSVSPVSEEELLAALDRIPLSRLNSDEMALIDKLHSSFFPKRLIESDDVAIDTGIILTPELYMQTKALDRQYDYAFAVKDMKSFLTVSADFYLYDNLLMFADYLFISPGLQDQFAKKFGTNVDARLDFQHEGIFNCGLIAGGKHLYGGVFRTRQAMGYGKTGNLMVADNFSRQDFMRFHFNSNWFDYTLNLTHFDQSTPYTDDGTISFERTKFNGMQQVQGIHRFEAKFYDKARVVFQEGVMLNSTTALDVRLLNPFIYFHGLYNFTERQDYEPGKTSDEANNYISVELNATLYPHLSCNLQLLADQIQLPGERHGSSACPEAYGILFNIESPWIVKDNWLNVWYESVYMMPYTYLNKKTLESGKYDTNLDMITGYHNNCQDEVGYAGYKYGPDSIVNAIGVETGVINSYQLGFTFTYLIHGQYGYGYKTIIPERGEEHIDDMALVGLGIANAEHRLMFDLNTTWYAFDGLELGLTLSYHQVYNYKCQKGETLSNLMGKVYISLDPIRMFL